MNKVLLSILSVTLLFQATCATTMGNHFRGSKNNEKLDHLDQEGRRYLQGQGNSTCLTQEEFQKELDEKRTEARKACGAQCGITCQQSTATLTLSPVICGGCIGSCFSGQDSVILAELMPQLCPDEAP